MRSLDQFPPHPQFFSIGCCARRGGDVMDRLNQWLTLLANIGVFVGLVFVVIEVRQNTDIARMQAYRENTQDIASWRSQMASDPSLVALWSDYWMKGRIDQAPVTDQRRAGMLAYNLFTSYENAYLAHKFGIIEESEWLRFLPAACMHFDIARQNDREPPFLTAEFRRYLDASCLNLSKELRIEPLD
jgi:hypothetical protein